jgi:hypothetical protein
VNVVDEHIAALLLEWIRQHGGGHKATFTPQSASGSLKVQMGVNVSEFRTAQVLDALTDIGVASKSYSPLTNGFFDLSRDNAVTLFGAPGWTKAENQKPARNPSFDIEYPVIDAYLKSDPSWSGYVMAELQRDPALLEDGGIEFAGIGGVPASDRIVTLSDNQQTDLEASTTELIEIVEKQNGVDGDQSMKQQIVGQLKAGRELVLAGVFKLVLIEQTILSVLGGLIEKYKNQAIGQAAKKLLDLLIEYVVGK